MFIYSKTRINQYYWWENTMRSFVGILSPRKFVLTFPSQDLILVFYNGYILHAGYILVTHCILVYYQIIFWYYYDLYSKFCYIFLETHHFFIKKEIYLVASNSLQHALIFESIIHNSLTLLLSLQLTNYLKPFLPKKPCLILISTSYTKIAFLWQWNLCFSISAAPML